MNFFIISYQQELLIFISFQLIFIQAKQYIIQFIVFKIIICRQYVNSQKMGNSQQTQQELNFIQATNQHPFGSIQIYQAKSGLFLMKKVQSQAENHINIKSLSKVQSFALNYHPNIIPIVKVVEHQEFGMCGKVLVSEVYTEYYNYTLKDLLLSKKNLEESQLWYILKCLLNLSFSLKQFFFFINFSLQDIFLTLSGGICISHYQIQCYQFNQIEVDYNMLQMIGKLMVQLISCTFKQDFCKVTELDKLKSQVNKLSYKFKILSKVIGLLLAEQTVINQIIQYIDRLANDKMIQIATEIKLAKFKIQLPASQIQNIKSNYNLSQIFNQPYHKQKNLNQLKSSTIQNQSQQCDSLQNNKNKQSSELKININIVNEVQKKEKGNFTVKKNSSNNQSTIKRITYNQKIETNLKNKNIMKINSTQKKPMSSQKKDKSFRQMQRAPKTFATQYSNSNQKTFEKSPLLQQTQQSRTNQFGQAVTLTKEEKTKMYWQLQRKKQEFEGQKQRFKQKKQQLLLSCGNKSDFKAMILSKMQNLKTEEKKDEKLWNYGYKKNINSNKCHYR